MRKPPAGEAPITMAETLAALITASKRVRVPVRHIFIQRGTQEKTRPGLLSTLVGHHDVTGLDLLLVLIMATTAAPYTAHYDAGMWARTIGLDGPTARATISRAWKRLAELRLITRGRRGRQAEITLLREDGSGHPYTPPGVTRGDPYVQIPLAYWQDGWHIKLGLPAKAMLLVALSLPNPFQLPAQKTQRWYGISADTTERGLETLRNHQLLKRVMRWKRAPLVGEGFVKVYDYSLLPPFSHHRSRKPRPA